MIQFTIIDKKQSRNKIQVRNTSLTQEKTVPTIFKLQELSGYPKPHLRSLQLMKDGNFLKLIERYTTGALILPSSKSSRMFAAAMTTVMSHLPAAEHQPFVDKVG